MKKLLIAMTAAAVGTCAWAAVEVADATLLNENFNKPADGWSPSSWTVAEDGKVSAVAAPWSYAGGTDVGDGELTLANNVLSLNTGSKVLTAAFAGGDAVTIPSTNVYFNAKVTFKDPSDTLPTLGAQDKFALVVLDNVESFEAEPKLATTQTTNLFVIAQYGAESGTKRAYKLTIPTELDAEGNILNSITDLTADWLSTPKMIEVKAYNNVMADTEDARAGFLVSVDGLVCKVYASYPIVGGLIDFTDNGGVKFGMSSTDQYLGVAPTAITGSLQTRYTDDQLILSLTDNASDLSSVDFQGQGYIDDVSLKASATTDFGPDSLVLNVEKTDGITFEPGTSALMYYAQGDSVTIKFKVNEGFELELPANLSADENGVYTYVYTPAANDQTVTISAFLPKVSVVVGEETLKFGSLAKALESDSVVAGSELKLTAGYTVTEAITLEKNITINLNGQTLTAELADSFEAMFELANNVQLTITDDTENGSVVVTGLDRKLVKLLGRAAALAVDAGTFDACVAVDGLTYNITGGKFLATANKGGITVSNAYKTVVEGDYLKVVAKETFGLTVNKHNGVTITDANGNGLSFNDSYLEGTMLSFKVSYDTGAYQNLSVKVNDNDCSVTDGVYSFTVTAITVLDIQVTAISTGPTIDDTEGEITVDQNTGNATIDTTNATVTVTGTVTGDVIVTPSVGTVNVTLAAGKTVKVYSGTTDISGAFTVSSANGTTTIVLNENGSVNGVSVKPEMAAAGDGDEEMNAPLEVGTSVDVGVKTIPGLKYQLIRSDAPNGTFGGVGDVVTGTGAPVKLSDSNKPANKAFYKVKVSAR